MPLKSQMTDAEINAYTQAMEGAIVAHTVALETTARAGAESNLTPDQKEEVDKAIVALDGERKTLRAKLKAFSDLEHTVSVPTEAQDQTISEALLALLNFRKYQAPWQGTVPHSAAVTATVREFHPDQ